MNFENIRSKLNNIYTDKMDEECPDISNGCYSWDVGFYYFMAEGFASFLVKALESKAGGFSESEFEAIYKDECLQDCLETAVKMARTDFDGNW